MLKKLILTAALLASATTAHAATEFSKLRSVNFDVNNQITYKDDRGGKDTWTIPTKYGDCEDFALLKRKVLIDRGWDPSDIKLILVVRTIDLKKKKVIDYAHVMVYIPSTDTVLDIPADTQGDYGFKKNEYTWDEYMRTRGFSPVCDIANMTEGTMSSATGRCGKRY